MISSASQMAQVTLQLTPVLLLILVIGVHGGYPSSSYGYPAPKKYPYLPAPPGETPTCAKNGATYCEKIETYPTEVITYLLYKWGRTYQQFIRSESDRDFFLISKTYPPAAGGYDDPYKPPVSGGYSSQPSSSSSSYLPTNDNNNNNYQQQGYGNNSNYVASYYRDSGNNNNRYQREHTPSGGYGYSFSIPPRNQQHQGGSENYLMAAAVPPVLQSVWWNHRDAANQPAFPHIAQHNQQGHQQRSRAKRQASFENQLCQTRKDFITPRAAMNNEGNWMYVVNMERSQYVQMVRTEQCISEGGPCNGICSVPPGYSATCRQKYVQKRLVALDGSGETLRNDVFWLPHCCECQINS